MIQLQNNTREKMSLIVNSSIDAGFLIDVSGQILDVNQAALSMFGWEKEKLLGNDFFKLIIPEELKETYKASIGSYVKTLNQKDLIRRVEISTLTKDGLELPIELSLAPLPIIDRKYFNICIRDLSSTKHIESESEHLFNQSLDLICLANVEGFFLRVNPSFISTLGYSQSELLSKPFLDFVHNEDMEATLAEIDKLSSGMSTVQFENRYRCRNGEYKWLSWKATPNSSTGIIYAIARDITDTKKLNKKLSDSIKDLSDLKYAIDESAIVAITDKKGIIKYTNSRFCAISGYAEDELVGEDHRIINSGHHPKSFFEDLWKTIKKGEVWKNDVKNLAKDGSFYWVNTTIVPITEKNGRPQQYIALRYDITERKRMEQTLMSTNALQKAILNSASSSIITTDRDGAVTSFNKGCEMMLGYSQKELRDLKTALTIHDETEIASRAKALSEELGRNIKPNLEAFVAKANLGIPDTNEWTYIGKNGEKIPVMLTVSGLKNENDDITGYVHIARDISHEKESLERKLSYMREIEAINRELDGFAYIVSHDLKAPLRAIGSLTDWIYEDNYEKLTEDSKEHLKLLKSRVERMHGLIEGVLSYSRAGREKEPREDIDFNKIIGNIVESLTTNEHVTINLLKKFPVIQSNAMRISQVFQNLIVNAIKYNDKEEVVINIDYRKVNGLHEFSIEDNGPGIDEKYHDKVFGLFQTLQSRDKFESTGVGLSIVKKIIEMHDGEIKIESNKGKGCKFVFTLKN